MEKKERSSPGIIRFELSVKSWLEALPGVEQVRPAHCPSCGAASRPIGGRLVLHGHGKRERQVWGPQEPHQQPCLTVLQVRRYRCQACAATCTVAPWELFTRRLYSLSAVVWALALWSWVGLSLAKVRERVSPFTHRGHSTAHTWPTVRRWVKAVRERRLLGHVRPWPQQWSPRQAAGHIAQGAAGHAPYLERAPPLTVQAFLGAPRAA